MKRLIALICCICLMFGCVEVSAENTAEIRITGNIILYGSTQTTSNSSSSDDRFGGLSQAQVNTLRDSLYDCIWNMKESIDVSNYGFYLHPNGDDYYVDESLINIYSEVVATYPYLFNSKEFNVSADGGTLKITRVYPIYETTKEEYSARVDFCRNEIEKIISGIPEHFSDAEKVVYVQDYLAINYAYDTRLFSTDTAVYKLTVSDMYGFLKEGVGVCQSYTAVFNAVMSALGIESESVIDRTDNHIWNIVNIDGEYYHLDCTHDDPLFATSSSGDKYDFKGIVRRTCLLLNDDEMAVVAGHSEWHTPLSLSDITCDSDRFSGAAFRNIDTPLSYYNGYWYGAEASLPTVIYRVSRDFTTKEAIYTLDENYEGNLNKIKGSLLIGNCLYINSLFEVIRLNLDTLTATTLYTSSEQINTVYYYGNGYIGVVKNFDFNNSSDNKFRLKIGDINCDNYINVQDLITIQKHILGNDDKFFSHILSDVTCDGSVNLVDLVRMKKYLVGMITEF